MKPILLRPRCIALLWTSLLACLHPQTLSAGLDITASPKPMSPPRDHPSVLVHHATDDKGGNTSLRFMADRKVDENKYEKREIEGWRVFVQQALLASEPALTARALELLKIQLAEINRVVPAEAAKSLRSVPLYFSPEYAGFKATAEFHPDAGWLRANRRDPAMARAVEFSNVRRFEAEMDRMPNFTLHELAHAYHHRVFAEGFANPEIQAAYERAKAGGRYDRVERWFGTGKTNSFERAYAMNNPMEYFAETTEAFFSRNDFFPFTRDELRAHDPEMFILLAKLWGISDAASGNTKPGTKVPFPTTKEPKP